MDLTYDGYDWRRDRAIQAARDVLHVQISRNSLLWHKVEAVKGVRDWSIPDDVVADLRAAGIEPLLVIVGSPSWANGTPTSVPDFCFYVPTTEAVFQSWLTDYTSFVTEAVTRYKGKVHYWEIWNEQNEHYFWKPKPNADQYARFYAAVKAAILVAQSDCWNRGRRHLH